VVAKALTSGYVPIGAAIATKHVADAFAGPDGTPFDHRITFGGNPVSCAAKARLAQRARPLMERHGLLGRAGNIFFIAPPLCVTRGELDFLVNQLGAVIAELQADLLTRGNAA
jgi:adenosylmethionine-8-amino-7-oxononanoate aminotransferase